MNIDDHCGAYCPPSTALYNVSLARDITSLSKAVNEHIVNNINDFLIEEPAIVDTNNISTEVTPVSQLDMYNALYKIAISFQTVYGVVAPTDAMFRAANMFAIKNTWVYFNNTLLDFNKLKEKNVC